jgi:ribosomal protein S18 acetylase RimI-like enzyme
MVIVDLQHQYLDAFYDCFSELMREGYGQFPPELSDYFLSHDYLKDNFKLWLERNFRKVLLALDEKNEVIGFLVGDHSYGGVGFISWFGIRKSYRDQNIGTQLFDLYQAYILGRKAHLIELYTYEGARGFYEKLGFKEIGRREHGFFGQKNLIMNKKIGDWQLVNLNPV